MVFKRAPITAKGDDKTTKFKVDAIGCLRYTWYLIMLGWETYKHYYEAVELPNPTPTQPNPRKIRLKVAFGPLFPTATSFSWVGIGFI